MKKIPTFLRPLLLPFFALLFSSGLEAQESWEAIQPPLRNPVADVFFNDNYFFLHFVDGFKDGALARSADQGIHWEPLPFTLLHNVHYLNSTSGQLFAWNYASVFRSDDNGTSWQTIHNFNNGGWGPGPGAMAMPADDVLVFTFADDIYRSQDAGMNWDIQHHSGAAFSNISYDSLHQCLRTWDVSGSALWQSTDKGITWTQHPIPAAPTNGPGWEKSFSSATGTDSTVFVGLNDQLFRSTDHGSTWTQSILPTFPAPTSITSIVPAANGKIFVNTIDSLLNRRVIVSPDNGFSWSNYTESNAEQVFCLPPNVLFLRNNRLQLFRSDDNGNNWTLLEGNRPEPVLDFYSDGDRLLCLTSYGLSRSNDNGQTWVDLYRNQDVIQSELLVIPDSNVYLAGANVYRSENNGATFDDITPLPSEPGFAFKLDGSPSGTVLVGTNKVFRSEDEGNSWNKTLDTASLIHVIVFVSDKIWLLGTWNGTIFRSEDDGVSWTQVYHDPAFSLVWQIVPAAGGVVYANFGYTLLKSSDWGGTWLPLPLSLPDFSFCAIIVDKKDRLYAQDANGLVYRSVDGGQAFAPLPYCRDICGAQMRIDSIGNLYIFTVDEGYIFKLNIDPTYFRVHCVENPDNTCATINPIGQLKHKKVKFKSPNTTFFASTGDSGELFLTVPPDTLDISIVPSGPYSEPCPVTLSIAPDDLGDTLGPVLLTQTEIAQCPYLATDISALNLRRCFDATLYVNWCNLGTAPAPGAYLEVKLDSFFDFLSAGLPHVQTGDKYRFELGNIAPDSCGTLKIEVHVSCAANLGKMHCYSAHIYPDALCLPGIDTAAVAEECRPNTGSFDPNDKTAFVGGRSGQVELKPGAPLEYLIRFQNTGTDTAFTVRIRDTLPAGLDPESVRPGASSHPYSWKLLGQGVLELVFSNILLPDSTVDESGSHGFVKFQVYPKTGLTNGTSIRNRAGIYFDFNEPVLTNFAELTLADNTAPWDSAKTEIVKIYPNPAFSSVTLEFEREHSGQLLLFNMLGNLLSESHFSGQKWEMELFNLPPGVYLLYALENGKRLKVGKVVVGR